MPRTHLTTVLVLRSLAVLLWMAVIFFFSSLPGSPYPVGTDFWYKAERKGAHIFEYFILLFLVARFFMVLYPREKYWKILLAAAGFSLAYATTDELHQFFIPFRGAKFMDVLFDAG